MSLPSYHFVTRSPVISKTIKNTNDLLFTEPDVIVTAGKTGFLYESMYNYAVRAYPKDDPNQELIVIVFGAQTRSDSVDAAVKLAKWAWDAYDWKDVPSSLGVTDNYEVGDRGTEVMELQRFLNANGYVVASAGPGSPGNETEYFGSLTREAVKRFQEANRTAVLDPRGASRASGYLDFLTRAAINTFEPKKMVSVAAPTGIATSLPPMRVGMTGTPVRTLQELLAREPDVYPEALVTGYFGPLTKQAVQRFQMKHGLVSSAGDPGYGYVGPKTRARLSVMYGA
jgi:peptidoglycan hydrolase-like protein with peptidoglycan-binding domain